VLVRGSVRRDSVKLGGGKGSRLAGMMAMILIIVKIWGGGSLPWAMAAARSSMSYRCRRSMIWAVSVSAAMLESTQNGRGYWCTLWGSSIGDPCIASNSAGSSSFRRSDWMAIVRC
jgi:hypothetical protein